jgi:hypothetical protein
MQARLYKGKHKVTHPSAIPRDLAASTRAAYYRRSDQNDSSIEMAPSDPRITSVWRRSGAAKPVAI